MVFTLRKRAKYFNKEAELIVVKELNNSLSAKTNFSWFFIPIILFWILGIVLLCLKGYKGSFLMLNGHFITSLDFPIYLITHIGNGLMVLSILAILWTKDKIDLLICAIISVITSGLMVQILKNYFFSNWSRPIIVLEPLHLPIHMFRSYVLLDNTFPSGHSTTIACVFTIVAFAYRNKSKIFLLALGIFSVMIIYTRVYLGVHFLGDILAGSLLGVCCSLVIIQKLNIPIKAKISKLYLYPKTSLYLRIIGVVMFLISIFVVYKNF